MESKIIANGAFIKVGTDMTFPNPSCDRIADIEWRTWKKDVALKQVSHIVSHIQGTLETIEALGDFKKAKNAVRSAQNVDAYLDAKEWLERALWRKKHLAEQKGSLIWEGLYRPQVRDTQDNGQQLNFVLGDIQPKKRAPRTGLEFDDAVMSCLACSL